MSRWGVRLSLYVLLAMIAANGCAQRPVRESVSRDIKQGGHVALPVDFAAGPVTSFERACARCHGPGGSLYGEDFTRIDDHKLAETVAEMMTGPGALKPTPAELAAMIDYHRALRDGRPFVCILNGAAVEAGQGAVLRGEATKGAALTIRSGSRSIVAEVRDVLWSVPNPPPLPFDVAATAGNTETRFRFPARQWSDGSR